MSIKVDDWNDIPDSQKSKAYEALSKLLKSYPTFSQSTIPTLADSRGKIFLLNRMNTDLSLGVPIAWSDNVSGKVSPSQKNRDFCLYVQDKYEKLGDGSKSVEEEKRNLFVSAMEEVSPEQMLLNFASGVKNKIMGVYVMNLVLQYFGAIDANSRPTLLGWSLFDYITSNYSTNIYGNINVLQMIISSNFGYSNYPDKYDVDVINIDL